MRRPIETTVQCNANMDSKVKFSDRLKALLKTDARQDIDPYVFSEPEPFASGAGKARNLVTIAKGVVEQRPRKSSSSSGSSSSKPRTKCSKQKVKAETTLEFTEIGKFNIQCCYYLICQQYSTTQFLSSGTRVFQKDELARKGNNHKALETSRYSDAIARRKQQRTLRSLERLKYRKRTRDHTLLYYPKAGDEISDSDSSGDDMSVYQRHWFTAADANGTTLNRSTRISQLRSQLRRRLIQLQV